MPKMLTKEEVVDLIEQQFHTKVWNVCMVGLKGPVEGTDYVEIMLGARHQKDVDSLEDIFKDVLNVNEIRYTGPIMAAGIK